jgi:hypothetical protein
MSTESSINKRIQKLLRLAEHPNTPPPEAELASRQAEKLMLKLGIDEAMLRAGMGEDEKPEGIVIKYTAPFPKTFIKPRHHLAASIAKGMRLKAWISGSTVAVMGFESDVERALGLIPSLVIQADNAMASWWKGYEYRTSLTAAEAKRAKRQFLYGFASTVSMRLTELYKENIEESVDSKSTALVLRNRDKQLDDEFTERIAGSLRSGRGVKGSFHGGAAGREAGSRANLGGTALGGSPRGVLGR